MNQPAAQCVALLAGGARAQLTATCRARDGRAEVKCTARDAALAQRMQQVVRLARHTEPAAASQEQVVIGLEGAPPPEERGWELAAVLADRMARGLYRPAAPLLANGWSNAWERGRVDGHTLDSAAADVMLGGADGLAHLGQLDGGVDPGCTVSAARAWFPLCRGEAASLHWLEVSVFPARLGGEEESTISAPELDLVGQQAVRRALAGARHFEGAADGRWRTVVRFGQPHFQGRSFELALVIADRLARGREFPPRGRVLATGCSAAWHAGRVDPVDGMQAKCALFARVARPGDRVLLPQAWQGALPPGLEPGLRARGASLACVARIGIL